ncbi:NAD(+) synthase (glutamine-hydrolyzing) 2 [Halorubrum aidingense JCM 13560]|uniref:NH(3)-dependent NAD(+) synthetase n=1 Tax=Halorubrum aidingense JCM 13560 TaxID=1230454 RepID=M0PC85_9EURY|nr:NAD(+) synthase [Halorubrum aidingense]EMA67458.1 NAD(+) synthase (glutamine-hydrolyzing) 2 [Halorubrum aidingense JCM 13560]
MNDPKGTAFDPETAKARSAAPPDTTSGGDPGRDGPDDDGSTAAGVASCFKARDPAAERERIRSFIEREAAAAGADGVVVNMSGGLDSTVTAALAVEALGADRVYGLILPCNKIGAPHARDAEALADALGIEHDTVHLQPLFAQFGAVAPDRFDLHDEPIRSGNAVARLRMAMAYLAANAANRLVCGTTNRSERLLGYYTKHGDGAADLLPLGHLYKTDVRALAAELDVPAFVVEKPPTAGFLPGQRDVDDLGAPYEVIDPVLQLGVDRGLDAAAIVDRIAAASDGVGDEKRDEDRDEDRDEGSLGVPTVDAVTRLLDRHRESAHKRLPPPTPTSTVTPTVPPTTDSRDR